MQYILYPHLTYEHKQPRTFFEEEERLLVIRMWNSEAITSLLEKVSHEDVLWNVAHPYYHKKTLKRTLFDKICAELKTEYPLLEVTTVEVMDKFKYLRGQYQKILRKIRNTPSGSAANTAVKWEHYNTCSFMQSVYDTGPTESSFIHLMT
ncbi:uncharacterized protein LOC122257814 [Penaeus japonicus]|uniref:uncharacterized protein LOC122257814 n=1 Tax=Penaeus japonicus TaxID=27405 RepID=UPI001C70FE1D|nr:uncharacterized protein LOC122257814 [Penaeus japonicus]